MPPSGHPQPSQEDIQIIKRLYEVGNLIGISVLDHVVIGGQGSLFQLCRSGNACVLDHNGSILQSLRKLADQSDGHQTEGAEQSGF